VVRFADGGGLTAAYVRDAAAALGPLQRGSLADPAMFDHFIHDLTALHLLAGRAEAALLPADPALAHRAQLARERLLAEAWIDAELARRRPVTEAQLHRYFADHAESFQTPGQVRFRQILVATRAAAEEVVARIEGGSPFAGEARHHSLHPSAARGGEMGWHDLQRLEPTLRDALAGLAPGARSPVVASRFGFQVVELEARRSPRPIPYAVVRDRIARQMRATRRRALADTLVKEEWEAAGAVVDPAVLAPLARDLRTPPAVRDATPGAGARR